MRLLAGVALVSLPVLAACAAPAVRTISGDGDYRGSATRVQALRRDCPRPGLLRMPVRNGVMFYRWNGQDIQVTVLNNGTLSGAAPGVVLSGTHDGTIMQGDVMDSQCRLHFTLTKIGA